MSQSCKRIREYLKPSCKTYSYKMWHLAVFIAFAVFVSGCAGAKMASLPQGTDPSVNTHDDFHVLAVGEKAWIEVEAGKTFVGIVERVSSDSVTLSWTGNYGYERKTIHSAEILSIEVGVDTRPDSVAASSGTALVLVALSVFAFLVYAFSGSGFN